jgi:hypothetical protein
MPQYVNNHAHNTPEDRLARYLWHCVILRFDTIGTPLGFMFLEISAVYNAWR